MMMDPTDQLLAYVMGQTTLLGVLAGLVAGTAGYPARLVPHLPRCRDVGSSCGAGSPIWVGALDRARAAIRPRPAHSGRGRTLTDRELGMAGTPYAVGALLPVFLVGVVAGSFLAAPAGALVEQRSGGAPQVAFVADYAEWVDGRGILTVTHDGGDLLRTERLYVEGGGITDIPGANQTEPGPRRGKATVEWKDNSAVNQGDAVAVGVEGECMVRIVYRTEWSSITLSKHTCLDAVAE